MQSLSTTLRRMLPGVAFAVAASGPAALGAQQGTWALTNARIETVTKGVIEKGTIIIRDGLITAVGADVAIPADARVIDYSKRTISPALIDLTSSLGLPAGAPAAGGGGRGGAGGPAAAGSESKFNGFDPNRVVSEEVKVGAADTRAAREGGIGAALVAPTRGALRGMSVLVPMKDSANGFDAVKVNVAQHFGFSGGGGGFGGGGRNAAGENLPGTIMGVIAYQRQALYDARRYGQILDRWKADPTGIARPTNDPELESLVPAARGQMPIFYDTPQENDIRRAVKMAKEFDLKFTLVGVTEGFKALDALAGYPVVVSTNFPQPASVTGWSYRNAMRQNPGDSLAADREARKAIEGNAAALHKAGVKFALGSGGMRGVDFLANIRKAVAAGLLADVALQAATIRAAELAGVYEDVPCFGAAVAVEPALHVLVADHAQGCVAVARVVGRERAAAADVVDVAVRVHERVDATRAPLLQLGHDCGAGVHVARVETDETFARIPRHGVAEGLHHAQAVRDLAQFARGAVDRSVRDTRIDDFRGQREKISHVVASVVGWCVVQPLGRPSTRSPRMLRITFDVPPMMVYPGPYRKSFV